MERPAYLAGRWYPATADGCKAAIERYATETEPERDAWRGIIAPHAGWAYSGGASAHGYRWLAEAQSDVDLVIVYGSHRGPAGPNSVFLEDAWETPLGSLQNAKPLAQRLAKSLRLNEEPVSPLSLDNAVELHLPFVRYFFPRAELLMLGVAASDVALEIGETVAQVTRDAKRRAVVVGSTDLTHYGPNYDFMPRGQGRSAVDWVRHSNDQGFIDAVIAKDAGRVLTHAKEHQSACCPGAAAATMRAAAVLGGAKRSAVVDHYLSCDVQPAASFVGYASIVL